MTQFFTFLLSSRKNYLHYILIGLEQQNVPENSIPQEYSLSHLQGKKKKIKAKDYQTTCARNVFFFNFTFFKENLCKLDTDFHKITQRLFCKSLYMLN